MLEYICLSKMTVDLSKYSVGQSNVVEARKRIKKFYTWREEFLLR